MNRQRIHLLPLLVLLALMSGISAKAQRIQLEGTVVKPSDEHIQYIGRFSFKNPDSPAFTYPGVQINARFEGTSLKMLAKPMSGYFMAQIDNGKPFKVGYAGGFNPENVADKLHYLLTNDEVGDFWIDMESGVRTDDWFDLDKVRRVLAICNEVIRD